MKKFLLKAIAVSFTSSLFAQNDKPNVLFIAIDDMRPELNCYGESQIISPNMDRLANEGITFTRAYCQQALCGPSRLSLMTGMHPDGIGNYGMNSSNKIEWRDYRPGVTSLPEQFRNNGYYAEGFGKIYDNRLGIDEGYSWDKFTQGWKGAYSSPRAQEILATADSLIAIGEEPDIIRPAVDFWDTTDETYTDGSNTKLAVEFLQNYIKDEPFFLAVGFSKPHLPFVAPKKYWDLYDRNSIKLPQYANVAPGFTEYTLSPYKEIESYISRSIIDEDKTKELRHGYYACISYVDAQIGKILQALEDKGELQNTIIVLWGDHGFKLGDFGEWAKATNLEIDTRVPFIIRFPKKSMAGTKIATPIELTDIMPTLCDFANIETPSNAEGKSLLPLLCDQNAELRPFALTQYPRNGMAYSIRTQKWRYTEYVDKNTFETREQELYLIRDEILMEEENVEDLYPEEVARLSKMLHDYLETAPRWDGPAIPY
ncbi:MAG: sulfatase [Bacteroidales bacterium]|nr:sulfatase [Bacteroidales bacterium]